MPPSFMIGSQYRTWYWKVAAVGRATFNVSRGSFVVEMAVLFFCRRCYCFRPSIERDDFTILTGLKRVRCTLQDLRERCVWTSVLHFSSQGCVLCGRENPPQTPTPLLHHTIPHHHTTLHHKAVNGRVRRSNTDTPSCAHRLAGTHSETLRARTSLWIGALYVFLGKRRLNWK